MAPVPVVLSPKAQAYEAIVPSESVEVLPLNATTRLFGVEVNAAVGGLLALLTVTDWVLALVPPLLSVTVSVTE